MSQILMKYPRALSSYRLITGVLCALLIASCGGPVPTQEEIKQDNRDNRAEQLVRVGDTTREGGDFANAMQLYARAASMRVDWAVPLKRLGETAMAARQYARARNAYQRASNLEPRDAENHLGMGRADLKIGDYENALAAFETAARLAPEDNRGHNGAGVTLDLMGEHKRAQDRYITGMEKAPDNFPLQNNLGLSLALTGEGADAIEVLQKAANAAGSGPETRLNLALVYGLMGDEDKARQTASLDLKPAEVANNLLYYKRLRMMSPEDRIKAVFGLVN